MNSETTQTAAPVDRFVIQPFYDQGGITIYNARCEQVLPFLDPVDLVVTDPPYGLESFGVDSVHHRRNKSTRGNKCEAVQRERVEWDAEPPPRWLLDEAIQKAKHAIVFGGNYYQLPPARCWLVWDKDNTGNFGDCELAWTTLAQAIRKIRWRWNGMIQEAREPRIHPTQKPLAVMKWAIGQAPDTVETVLDPFMGVGTTLVAAKLMGKRAIGIEALTEYCERAVERLRQGVLPFAG